MAIRLCSYNIEKFNELFHEDNSLKTSGKSGERLQAIGRVFEKIDADLIGIQEAPNTTQGIQSTIAKLENFASHYNLRTAKALTGFLSNGSQEIAVLYDPDILSISHDPSGTMDPEKNPRFDGEFHFDADDDNIREIYRHYRPPIEASVRINATRQEFRLLVAHIKSKGIFDNVDMIHVERESRRNRLKIYAECQWVRSRVEEWLDHGLDVVVMGDINDGPGMDEYEMRYGKSGVEVIMGSLFDPDRLLRNLAGRPMWGKYGWTPSSARFTDRFTGDPVNVLIDHILLSHGLWTSGDKPHRIWNPFENDELEPVKQELLTASDHFPVTIDFH